MAAKQLIDDFMVEVSTAVNLDRALDAAGRDAKIATIRKKAESAIPEGTKDLVLPVIGAVFGNYSNDVVTAAVAQCRFDVFKNHDAIQKVHKSIKTKPKYQHTGLALCAAMGHMVKRITTASQTPEERQSTAARSTMSDHTIASYARNVIASLVVSKIALGDRGQDLETRRWAIASAIAEGTVTAEMIAGMAIPGVRVMRKGAEAHFQMETFKSVARNFAPSLITAAHAEARAKGETDSKKYVVTKVTQGLRDECMRFFEGKVFDTDQTKFAAFLAKKEEERKARKAMANGGAHDGEE